MALPGKTYTQRERRLLNEYMARTYPNVRVITNVRLGAYPMHVAAPLPPNIPPSALSSFRRYADALVILPDKLILVEAKIIQAPGAGDALDLYEQLLPNTPELAPYIHLPVNKLCIAAVSDPVLSRLWNVRNIEVTTYTPFWIYDDLMPTEFNTVPPKIRTPTPLA